MTNLVAAFNRWDAACWNYLNQSLTGQEYTWGGIADYAEPYPCPNGLGLSERKLSDSPAYRRRVEKARRDAARHEREVNIAIVAESITDEQMEVFLKAIKETK